MPSVLGSAIMGMGLVVGGGNWNPHNPAWLGIIPGISSTNFAILLRLLGSISLCCFPKCVATSFATHAYRHVWHITNGYSGKWTNGSISVILGILRMLFFFIRWVRYMNGWLCFCNCGNFGKEDFCKDYWWHYWRLSSLGWVNYPLFKNRNKSVSCNPQLGPPIWGQSHLGGKLGSHHQSWRFIPAPQLFFPLNFNPHFLHSITVFEKSDDATVIASMSAFYSYYSQQFWQGKCLRNLPLFFLRNLPPVCKVST